MSRRPLDEPRFRRGREFVPACLHAKRHSDNPGKTPGNAPDRSHPSLRIANGTQGCRVSVSGRA